MKKFILACLLLVPKGTIAGPLSFCSTIASKLAFYWKSEEFQKRVVWYNPFNLTNGRQVTASELLPRDFYTPQEGGAVVGISGYAGFRAELNQEVGDFLTGKYASNGKNIFHYNAESAEEFLAALIEVYEKAGPIKRLSLLGHGKPGDVELGYDHLSSIISELNQEKFLGLPNDLFARDAEIVLLSCNCIRGTRKNPNGARDQITGVFSRLARNGATIVASRQPVLFSAAEFVDVPLKGSDPKEHIGENFDEISIRAKDAEVSSDYRFYEHRILNNIALMPLIPFVVLDNTINIFRADEASRYQPVEVIKIPPETRIKVE